MHLVCDFWHLTRQVASVHFLLTLTAFFIDNSCYIIGNSCYVILDYSNRAAVIVIVYVFYGYGVTCVPDLSCRGMSTMRFLCISPFRILSLLVLF